MFGCPNAAHVPVQTELYTTALYFTVEEVKLLYDYFKV